MSNSFRISFGGPDILDVILTYIFKKKNQPFKNMVARWFYNMNEETGCVLVCLFCFILDSQLHKEVLQLC